MATQSVGKIGFGPWTFAASARELALHGRLVPVPPKVFDLLSVLIDNRHRVVSKDELLQALWPGKDVTESAVVRTVMLARRALSTDPSAHELIRTNHAVGYRFVGDVVEHAVQRADGRRPLRVALLPILNATGSSDFDWVRLGLAALISDGLAGESSLTVVPTPDTLPAVARLPHQARTASRAYAAATMLGLHACIVCELRNHGASLRLTYHCFSYVSVGAQVDAGPQGGVVRAAARMFGLRGGSAQPRLEESADTGVQGPLVEDPSDITTLQGVIEGTEASAMGRRLIKVVRTWIDPAAGAHDVNPPGDPFIDQLLSRGLQCLGEFRFRSATKLFQALLELDPSNQRARLALLTAMVNCRAEGVDRFAVESLSHVQARGDGRQTAMTHQLLAHWFSASDEQDSVSRGLAHARSAADEAAPYAAESWVRRGQLVRGRLLVLAGDFDEADALYRFVEESCQHDGDLLQLALAQDGHGWLEYERERLDSADRLWSAASKFYAAHTIDNLDALTLMNLAEVRLSVGNLDAARKLAAASEAKISAVQQPQSLSSIARAAARVYVALGSMAEARRALDRLRLMQAANGVPADWPSHIARAHLACGERDAATAHQELRQALTIASRIGSPTRIASTRRAALQIDRVIGSTDAGRCWPEDIDPPPLRRPDSSPDGVSMVSST